MIDPLNFVGPKNALVRDNIIGSIKPLLVDNISKRTETFYIHSISDGGATLIQGPYTIKIDCDESVVRHDIAFQDSYTFQLDVAKPNE